MVRSLLTVDASFGGAGRFVISNADMVAREEWARLSTVDSSLSGSQIVAATMLSHASAFPNRSAIMDLNKKDSVKPTDFPPKSSPSAPTMWVRVLQPVPHIPLAASASDSSGGKKKRDRNTIGLCCFLVSSFLLLSPPPLTFWFVLVGVASRSVVLFCCVSSLSVDYPVSFCHVEMVACFKLS